MVRKVAQLNGPFLKSPQQSLLDRIKNNWGISDPPASSIYFAFSFENMGTLFAVIVENMVPVVRPQKNGGARDRYMEKKRVQIFAKGFSALDKRFKMQENVQDILSDPACLQADGIDVTSFSHFEPIDPYTPADLLAGKAEGSQIARSFALVELHYDKEEEA